ncbi:hypothetical protein INR49_016924 [Caranx melampygus]|nr:hypothetical protein INR49_016924 [Caranx melampygus]
MYTCSYRQNIQQEVQRSKAEFRMWGIEQVQSRDGGLFRFLDFWFGQLDPAHCDHSADGTVSSDAAYAQPEGPVQAVIQDDKDKEFLLIVCHPPALLALSSLEQTIINIPDELVQLRMIRPVTHRSVDRATTNRTTDKTQSTEATVNVIRFHREGILRAHGASTVCCLCRRKSHSGEETESMAVKEISYREKLYPCPGRLE